MIEWIVQTLVASTLLIALVFLLRAPVSRLFGAKAAYALWALPALRFALPTLPGWQSLYVPIFRLHDHAATLGLVDQESTARYAAQDALSAAPAAAPIVQVDGVHWAVLLIALWLGVAALWFGWQMLRYRRFLGVALRDATLLTTECGVAILLTEHVDGPVAAGLLRRRIFLPADFVQRYGPVERRLALLHEGAHHDRGDILANLVALAVLALHWWNPLAHYAYRLFRADQELACDATVLAGVDRDERHAYGSAVLKSVSARMPGVACALSHKAELKRRLVVMARPAIGSTRQWLGVAVAIAAIGGGLLVTASGNATVPPASAILSPADLAEIEADARHAEHEGLRAAAEGRRAAEQARSEGRRDAELGRAEARRARDEARRDDDQARAEAARTRVEALREAEQARIEADHARREVLAAQAESFAARDTAQREIARTRASMAAQCAAKGRPVSANLPWDRLALCGDSGAAIASRAIAEARRGLANVSGSEE
jgi:beta-lactamase regulating signal transducer with metallopeptidase domain